MDSTSLSIEIETFVSVRGAMANEIMMEKAIAV